MQEEYISLVDELEIACRLYFAERLVSAYIHGSIDKLDAVYGISDLDYYVVISDNASAEDLQWQQAITVQLQKQFDAVDEIHLTIQSVDGLKNDPFVRFILTHNATLRMGRSIESIPDYQNCERYEPCRDLAQMRLSFARKCFEEALCQQQPECTGEIPSNAYYAARKLARYFVIIEGAYFLMARGGFCGFEKENVMFGLRKEAAHFLSTLNMVDSVLSDPLSEKIDRETFLKNVKPLVEWMFSEIENTTIALQTELNEAADIVE